MLNLRLLLQDRTLNHKLPGENLERNGHKGLLNQPPVKKQRPAKRPMNPFPR